MPPPNKKTKSQSKRPTPKLLSRDEILRIRKHENDLFDVLRNLEGVIKVDMTVTDFKDVLNTTAANRNSSQEMAVCRVPTPSCSAVDQPVINTSADVVTLRFRIMDRGGSLYDPCGISFVPLSEDAGIVPEDIMRKNRLFDRVHIIGKDMYVTLAMHFVAKGEQFKFSVFILNPQGALGVIDPIIERDN